MGMDITETRLKLLHENDLGLGSKTTDLYDKEGNACGTRIELQIVGYNEDGHRLE